MSTDPIEVTTRYATTVDDLGAAWAFIMERLDIVGPDPRVEINPMWTLAASEVTNDQERPWPRRFEVVVSGMVRTEGNS